MEEHGLRQRDLLDVFGSRGIASSAWQAIDQQDAGEKARGVVHVPATSSFDVVTGLLEVLRERRERRRAVNKSPKSGLDDNYPDGGRGKRFQEY